MNRDFIGVYVKILSATFLAVLTNGPHRLSELVLETRQITQQGIRSLEWGQRFLQIDGVTKFIILLINHYTTFVYLFLWGGWEEFIENFFAASYFIKNPGNLTQKDEFSEIKVIKNVQAQEV